jgi:uncharacterized membrane protein
MWLLFAFICSFFNASAGAWGKNILRKIDLYVTSEGRILFVVPFLIIALGVVGVPKYDWIFWVIVILDAGLNVIANLFYLKALQISDLSLTVPLLSFTPVFLLLTSFLMLREFPETSSLFGIILVFIGSLFLNLPRKYSLINFFKSIVEDRGARFMLGTAFIWSFTANLDKLGVQHSSPVFHTTFVHIFLALFYLPIARKFGKQKVTTIFVEWKRFSIWGLLYAIAIIAQMVAIKMTLVNYVISIKRAGMIFSILFGYIFFKEKNVKSRLLGAGIMLAGVLLITL